MKIKVSKHSLEERKINSFYQFIFFSVLSIFLLSCSDGKLSTKAPLYGACERSEDIRFKVEDCESPTNCHVRDIGDGYCRPSCGYLSVISTGGKYRGYGKNTEANDDDDPHFLTTKTSCADLDKWGATDWKKIPLINNLDPHEVITNKQRGYTKSECCGSDRQVANNKN